MRYKHSLRGINNRSDIIIIQACNMDLTDEDSITVEKREREQERETEREREREREGEREGSK